VDDRADRCCTGEVRFELVTDASPDQVRRALTDFTDRRLVTWHRTLDPTTFELREHGDTWAVARESTPRSPFWVVARYDWSDPEVVRWTELESSYAGLSAGGDQGRGSVRIVPSAAGGSVLHVEWTYAPPLRARDRLALLAIHRTPMSRLIARLWRAALDEYAAAGPA